MDYENGKTEPYPEILKRIAVVLEINPTDLFDEYYNFLEYPYQVKVNEIRKRLKLTQKEFGEIFGLTASSVKCWESGRTKVTREIFDVLKSL